MSMLRSLLGQPPKSDFGVMQGAMTAMNQVHTLIEQRIEKGHDPNHRWRKYEVWTKGLEASLIELEESVFAAAFFAAKVKHLYVADMTEAEELEYHRHVYFFKNGFIRVFSVLDKLGTLMNDLFELRTDKVKGHFSYFTVLRQFDYLQAHTSLCHALRAIKETYNLQMRNLRKMRNIEIHYMNMEMQDDLWQREQALNGRIKLEDLGQKQADLEAGLAMVCETLEASFRYMAEKLKSYN